MRIALALFCFFLSLPITLAALWMGLYTVEISQSVLAGLFAFSVSFAVAELAFILGLILLCQGLASGRVAT